MVSLSLGVFLYFLTAVSARAVPIPEQRTENLCGNFGGYWMNELNSMMYIFVGPNGELSGTYGTAVETSSGAGKQVRYCECFKYEVSRH
jgi:hypothetical protein